MNIRNGRRSNVSIATREGKDIDRLKSKLRIWETKMVSREEAAEKRA